MNTHELFPETLLVSREGEHIYTTSRRVAFYFGKQHKDVLRLIQKLLVALGAEAGGRRKIAPTSSQNPEGGQSNFGLSSTREAEFGRRNFAESFYIDEWNRPQTEYELTHDGFMFLTMRFTGSEAMRWQIAFVEAFRQMESELADHHARRIAALNTLHPNLLPTVEDCERGLPRGITAQRLGRSVAAVTYHRRKARRLGLLAQRGVSA